MSWQEVTLMSPVYTLSKNPPAALRASAPFTKGAKATFVLLPPL
jgi:hypothetical protein